MPTAARDTKAYALRFLAVFAAYFVTGKMGLSFEAVGGFASLVWPPTGIAIAVMLLYGRNLWPAVLLGAFAVNFSSGAPIVCRVALKPTSSLPRPQQTVTRSGEPTEIAVKGRHDPCLLPRFVPMGEAMMALVLVDHWLRWRAQCGKAGVGTEPA